MFFTKKSVNKVRVMNTVQRVLEGVVAIISFCIFGIFSGFIDPGSYFKMSNTLFALYFALLGAFGIICLMFVHIFQHDDGNDLYGFVLYLYILAVACVGFMWTVMPNVGYIINTKVISFLNLTIEFKQQIAITSCLVLAGALLLLWVFEIIITIHSGTFGKLHGTK